MTALSRRRVLNGALAGAATLFAAPAFLRRAQAKTPVIVASLLGADKPETKVWLRFRDRIETELPGRFAFNIVTNAALGGEKQVVESMRLGAVHASLSTLSTLSAWVPEAQLFDMPFLFRDAAHVHAAVQGQPGRSLMEKLGQQDFVVGGYINYGARHLLAKEALTRPEQMAGKRIRIIPSPLHAALWSSFSAIPVAMPITETYNALSTGVVDAMDLTKSAYGGFKLYEVVPDLIETGHIWASGAMLFSTQFWSTLSAEEQALLSRTAADCAATFNTLIEQDEASSMEISKAAGARILVMENREEWEKGARQVWSAMASQIGGMEAIEAIGKLR